MDMVIVRTYFTASGESACSIQHVLTKFVLVCLDQSTNGKLQRVLSDYQKLETEVRLPA